MGHLRRKSKDRREELIDAALEIVATQGIAAVNTRRLAEGVGLTSGAIFRHFATLDELLIAVAARVETVLDATYPSPLLPPLARLEHLIAARIEAVQKQAWILRLVLSDQFSLAMPKEGAKTLAACIKKTRAFITAGLREAQEAGEVRSDLSAESLTPIVLGTIQMLAISATQPRLQLARAPVRESLFAMLCSQPKSPTKGRKKST